MYHSCFKKFFWWAGREAVLGLHCCMSFSLAVVSSSYSLVEVCRLLILVASLVVEPEL